MQKAGVTGRLILIASLGILLRTAAGAVEDGVRASRTPSGQASASGGEIQGGDSCRDCHQDEKFRVQNKKVYDYYQEWKGSAHDLAGLSCTACHNGDPSKPSQEEAHKGILPQSDPASPFHYRNIPKTCGNCHAEILAHFEKSRHFDQLRTTGRGPSCITCHGSLNSRSYPMTAVERSCANCHNSRTKNHPEVIPQAKDILGRLNFANGYRKGLAFYYKAIHKPEAMKKTDQAYQDVIESWHEFDFKRLGPRSQTLLTELKVLYTAATKQVDGKGEPKNP